MAITLTQTVTTAQDVAYTVTGALVVLLIGFGFGFMMKRLLYRLFHHLELTKNLARRGLIYDFEGNLSSLASWIIYFCTIVIVLNQLGLTSLVVRGLLGIFIILILLTLAVFLRDSVPNFLAGRKILLYREVREGNMVRLQTIEGKLINQGIFEMRIETTLSDVLHVPNSLFLKEYGLHNSLHAHRQKK